MGVPLNHQWKNHGQSNHKSQYTLKLQMPKLIYSSIIPRFKKKEKNTHAPSPHCDFLSNQKPLTHCWPAKHLSGIHSFSMNAGNREHCIPKTGSIVPAHKATSWSWQVHFDANLLESQFLLKSWGQTFSEPLCHTTATQKHPAADKLQLWLFWCDYAERAWSWKLGDWRRDASYLETLSHIAPTRLPWCLWCFPPVLINSYQRLQFQCRLQLDFTRNCILQVYYDF